MEETLAETVEMVITQMLTLQEEMVEQTPEVAEVLLEDGKHLLETVVLE